MALKQILAINPGSTSTKIAVYLNTKVVFLKSISHSHEQLSQYKKITDQYEFRKNIILKELEHAQIETDKIEAVVGRGGLIRPIKSGIYIINDRMKKDLREGILGEHASNLGGLIADDIAKSLPNAKAYIADPVVVDELEPVARIAGHPQFTRMSIFHALNQKATARSYSRLLNTKYEELNLIIAHMGGGISIGAHKKGRVIDVNNALDGEGPFSPERSGTLPVGQLIKKCFEKDSSLDDMKKMITGEGGLMAYFGTNSAYQIELMALDGDEHARLIQDAMSYQVAKDIGAMATVLNGEVDAIILTGGIANNPMVVEFIKKMVTYIAPVIIYPGEDEMHALAMNGLMVLKGEVEPKEYNEENMVDYRQQ
ncbi:MAG: butyrate kinase [Bacteroidales bacterium]|nr:butyrate kinase [Bacteroidales bacterium]MCB8998982.1 butyrate kinase [Bacteroidales bacterium]MCB9013731.1 butyrate kinase [Bacteroidales bacterium]